MKALAVDPAGIRHAVISHGQGDHLLGIYKVFPSNPSMRLFAKAYGRQSATAGAGKRIVLD